MSTPGFHRKMVVEDGSEVMHDPRPTYILVKRNSLPPFVSSHTPYLVGFLLRKFTASVCFLHHSASRFVTQPNRSTFSSPPVLHPCKPVRAKVGDRPADRPSEADCSKRRQAKLSSAVKTGEQDKAGSWRLWIHRGFGLTIGQHNQSYYCKLLPGESPRQQGKQGQKVDQIRS